jgi:hypothetical protein
MIAVIAKSGIPQLPSFSTPGFGKEKPRPPVSLTLHAHSSNETIDISTSATTSSPSARSIPYKRSSFDSVPAPPNSPKRQRTAPPCSDKENVFSAVRKGKEREARSPSPSQPHSSILHSLSEAASSSTSVQASRPVPTSTRRFTYNYKVHSDLQDVICVLSSFCPMLMWETENA